MKDKLVLIFCILLVFGLIGCDTGTGGGTGSKGSENTEENGTTGGSGGSSGGGSGGSSGGGGGGSSGGGSGGGGGDTTLPDLYGTVWDSYSPGYYYVACFGKNAKANPLYGDKVMQITEYEIGIDEYDGTYYWVNYSVNGDTIDLFMGGSVKITGSKAEYSRGGNKLEFTQITEIDIPDNLVGTWEHSSYSNYVVVFTEDNTVSTSDWGVFNVTCSGRPCTVKTGGNDTVLILFPDFDNLNSWGDYIRAHVISLEDEDTLKIDWFDTYKRASVPAD